MDESAIGGQVLKKQRELLIQSEKLCFPFYSGYIIFVRKGDSSMELQYFLSETLKQIIKGIQDAQEFVEKGGQGAKVNPRGITALKSEHGRPQPHDINTKLPIERVEFDVAITASDSVEKSGGGGLRVWALNVGGKAGTSSENTTISRVRFGVSIVLPDPYVKNSSPGVVSDK